MTPAALGLPSGPQSPAWEWSWPRLPFAGPSLRATAVLPQRPSPSPPNTHTGGGKASAPTSHSKKREGGDLGAFGRYLWKTPVGSGDVNQPHSLPAGTEPALVSRGGWWGDQGTCHPGTCLSRSLHLSSGGRPSSSSLLRALHIVNITTHPSIPSTLTSWAKRTVGGRLTQELTRPPLGTVSLDRTVRPAAMPALLTKRHKSGHQPASDALKSEGKSRS